MDIKIITTEDGSHSLYDIALNETYHSTRGARGESLHVFIKEGLEHWMSENTLEEVRILEVGLGTGLNAFLTSLWAEQKKKKIHLTSLEPVPIQEEHYAHLNYANSIEEKTLLEHIHTCVWETEVGISSYFELHKTTKRLEEFMPSSHFDIVYFDAFAPSKQPEVWSLENLQKCHDMLNIRGILTTYCAQGQFKRNLRQVGFSVETLQGAMGKKEMVRAVK